MMFTDEELETGLRCPSCDGSGSYETDDSVYSRRTCGDCKGHGVKATQIADLLAQMLLALRQKRKR